MIVLLADTTRSRGVADLLITPAAALPAHATKPWHIGHTYLSIRHTPLMLFGVTSRKSVPLLSGSEQPTVIKAATSIANLTIFFIFLYIFLI